MRQTGRDPCSGLGFGRFGRGFVAPATPRNYTCFLTMLREHYAHLLRLLLLLASTAPGIAGDWLTFGHDPQRTGWAFEETALTPANVSNLGLKWKSKLKNDPYSLSALTPPVVASDIST